MLLGLQSVSVNIEDGLTVLIDSEQYKQLAINSNKQNAELCATESEEYRRCGNKCVLACRYDLSVSGITIAKNDCDETRCVEGCFCKDGLVRYQNRCIPAKECPIRRNRAMDIMNEMSTPNKNETYTQIKAQNQTQAQNRNHTQINFQTQNPKIFGFGFFNRPGCAFGNCGSVPIPVQVHGYDETVQRKENNKVHSHSGSHFYSFSRMLEMPPESILNDIFFKLSQNMLIESVITGNQIENLSLFIFIVMEQSKVWIAVTLLVVKKVVIEVQQTATMMLTVITKTTIVILKL